MRLAAPVQEWVELGAAGGIETDDLAVEHGGTDGIAQAGERLELVIVPGCRAAGARLDVRDSPEAVPLHFEKPLGIVKRIAAPAQDFGAASLPLARRWTAQRTGQSSS